MKVNGPPRFQMPVNTETIKVGFVPDQPSAGKSLVNLFPFTCEIENMVEETAR